MGPTVAVMAHSASACELFSFGYEPSRMACESGISGPATAPCRIRAPSSTGRLGARPHNHEDMTNNRIAHTNSFTCPTRCVSQPVSGIDMALAAANRVMTHVPSSTETPRLPEIVGIATFAIDESSTFMNVASATAMVARTSWPPFNGGGEGAGGAAGAVLMGYPDKAAAQCNAAADCANNEGRSVPAFKKPRWSRCSFHPAIKP